MKKDGRCYEYSDLSYGTWEIMYKPDLEGGELYFEWFADGKNDEEAKHKSTWNYKYNPSHNPPLTISKC